MASPLIAGNDIRSMSSATQTILKNAKLIAINQDTPGPAGRSGRRRRHPAGAGQAAGQRRRRGGPVQPGRLDHDDLHHGRGDRQDRVIVHPGRRLDRHHHDDQRHDPRQRARRTARWCTGSAAAAAPAPPPRARPPPELPAALDRAQLGQRRVRALPRRAERQHRQRHPAGHLGLQRRRQPALDRQRPDACRRSASASTPRSTPPPAPRCSSGTATAAPTSSGPSTPTAPSAASSPGCVSTSNRNVTANGTAVLLWTCNAAANQRWSRS